MVKITVGDFEYDYLYTLLNGPGQTHKTNAEHLKGVVARTLSHAHRRVDDIRASFCVYQQNTSARKPYPMYIAKCGTQPTRCFVWFVINAHDKYML